MNFEEYCSSIDDGQAVTARASMLFGFTNSKGEMFNIDPIKLREFLVSLEQHHSRYFQDWESVDSRKASFDIYEEKSYRKIYSSDQNPVKLISTVGGSQTKSLTQLISKLICFLGGFDYKKIELSTFYDQQSLLAALANWDKKLTSKQQSTTSNRASFHAWLLKTGSSQRTATHYAHTGISLANRILASTANGGSWDLYSSNVEDAKAANKILIESVEWADKNTKGNGMYSAAMNKYITFLDTRAKQLSKPFLMLAGQSGTGKTRFVRQQAENTGSLNDTYCLVSVRPDWHEPADLLGYLSRLGTGGPEFVVTDTLRFLVDAWIASVDSTLGQIAQKSASDVLPYWLCLDEMNLAPVEQYFADYLSVMETRNWANGEYQCDPILKPQTFTQLGKHGKLKLRTDLGLSDSEFDSHWAYILENGVQLPFNLIVAGTVNMDETTHGFSRKVIDRALTLDFGDFFPNRFDDYFESTTKIQPLTFPRHSAVTKEELSAVIADSDGLRSIAFLSEINKVLKDTSFELAFRALNELLVSVVCHAPETDEDLQAVWDDFLMTKVLPRIEGDEDKLGKFGAEGATDLIPALKACLEDQLGKIWDKPRKDLYQTKLNDTEHCVPCRSKHKLAWMQQRLEVNGFTSFWP